MRLPLEAATADDLARRAGYHSATTQRTQPTKTGRPAHSRRRSTDAAHSAADEADDRIPAQRARSRTTTAGRRSRRRMVEPKRDAASSTAGAGAAFIRRRSVQSKTRDLQGFFGGYEQA